MHIKYSGLNGSDRRLYRSQENSENTLRLLYSVKREIKERELFPNFKLEQFSNISLKWQNVIISREDWNKHQLNSK